MCVHMYLHSLNCVQNCKTNQKYIYFEFAALHSTFFFWYLLKYFFDVRKELYPPCSAARKLFWLVKLKTLKYNKKLYHIIIFH